MADIDVTVAAVIMHHQQFLMVEEYNHYGQRVFNQPAGHLEHNESVIQAIKREVLEETGFHFKPEAFIGCYFLSPADNGRHYLRLCFSGCVDKQQPAQPQDTDIIATHWMTEQQISHSHFPLRSSLVLKSIRDYLSGQHYPLNAFHFINNESSHAEMCYTQDPKIIT